MMSRLSRFVFLFLLLVILLPPGVTAGDQPYIIDADTITYDYDLQELTASGNVFFRIPGLEVEADDIIVYIVNNEIRATGNIKLRTEEESITGEELFFNYNIGEGQILAAESEIDSLNFTGSKIAIVSEMDHAIEVDRAILTPCIQPDPHYRLEAETIKIYPGDRAVAENVSFYWGNTRLFTLGSYVLHYEKDEETGEEKLSRPVPTYEIGYDTVEGFYLELEYNYELFSRTSGGFYFTNTQRGRQFLSATNYFRIAENLELNTSYSREEIDEPDDDELEYEEIFETRLNYESADNFEIETGFLYHDEESEIIENYFADGHYLLTEDFTIKGGQSKKFEYMKNARDEAEIIESYFVGWDHQLTEDFTIRGRQSRELEYIGDARDEAGISKPLELSFDYNPSPFRFKYDYTFDFESDEYRQEYLLSNKFDGVDFSFYQDYRNGELDRQSYQLAGINYLDWRMRYRSGYDLEYLPYLDISKSLPHGFDLAAGMGRLNEKGTETGHIEIKPGWSGSVEITDGWSVEAKGDYNWYYYSNRPEQPFYANMTTGIGLSFKHETDSGYLVAGGLRQERAWSSGEPYLERDEKTERESYWPELNLRIPTEAPQSSVGIEFSGKYEWDNSEWDRINIGITRRLDCYSYGIEAELSNDRPAISFSFDLDL